MPPLVLPPQTPTETVMQGSSSTQGDKPKPNKVRAVMIHIHFYYGDLIKFLYTETKELKTFEMESKVVNFFDDQGLLRDLFHYSFRPKIEKVGVCNTLVLELNMGSDKVELISRGATS